MGRKSHAQELKVIERLAELTPKVFKFLNECLQEDAKTADKKWATERVTPALIKTIPQDLDVQASITTKIVDYSNIKFHGIDDTLQIQAEKVPATRTKSSG